MSRVVDAAASGCGEVAGKVVDFATTRTWQVHHSRVTHFQYKRKNQRTNFAQKPSTHKPQENLYSLWAPPPPPPPNS
jgi:hypothetical protein